MQVRALKTFQHKKYGLVRAGMVLTVPTSTFEQWKKVRPPLAEEFEPAKADEPGPGENKSIPGAPVKKTPEPAPGKGSPPAGDATPAASVKVVRKAGGRAKRSSSARADQA